MVGLVTASTFGITLDFTDAPVEVSLRVWEDGTATADVLVMDTRWVPAQTYFWEDAVSWERIPTASEVAASVEDFLIATR